MEAVVEPFLMWIYLLTEAGPRRHLAPNVVANPSLEVLYKDAARSGEQDSLQLLVLLSIK